MSYWTLVAPFETHLGVERKLLRDPRCLSRWFINKDWDNYSSDSEALKAF
jgi:hypothetical protein